MFGVRRVLPLIIPLLIITIPTVAYIIDSRSGAIPTQAAWDAVPHSSGPWAGTWIQSACLLLGIGGVIFTGSGAAFAATTGRAAQPWIMQGVGIMIASAVVFYFFGWLFE
jgi:hypothetical protein